jgi:NAD(P)-dependent dehydrogenase (short-subunit alcohol dehydrogenase family)
MVLDEDFDRVLSINFKGVLYCYRAAVIQVIKQGSGILLAGVRSGYKFTST